MNHTTQPTHQATVVEAVDQPLLKRVSWGAVFAGVTTAVIIQLLLTLLGVGIGAASIDPLQERAPGAGLGIGAGIWFFLTSLIAMYVGGRVAGQYSGAFSKKDRTLHGILTWASASILSVILLATAVGSLLGGTASLLGSAAGTAMQSPSAQSAVQESLPADPNRQPALPGQAEQKARETADVAARGVSQSALWSFFGLVLSGLAGAMGGRNSMPRTARHETEREPATHFKPQFAKP